MKKIAQKRILYFIKITITLTILYFVFRKIDFNKVVENFTHIPIISIIILILTAFIKLYFHFINWGKYLALNPDYLSNKKDEVKSFLIGEALRFLLPGGYGTYGKMYFVNNSKKATAVSVSVEKFFIIWTSLVFASFASIFYFNNVQLYIKIVIFFLILILPFFIKYIQIFIKHEKAEKYFKNYSKIISGVIFRQLIYTFLTIFQYFIIINDFANIMFLNVVISIPLVLSANILPITYSGLGLRETFAVEVLEKYQISPEIAVSCSLIIFIVNNILPAILGAFFIIRSKNN